jgi:outer membrane lipase/esterase
MQLNWMQPLYAALPAGLRAGLRAGFGGAAIGSALLLGACGDSSTFQPFQAARAVSFGDSLSDLGSAGARWTVNGVANSIWVETVVANYGLGSISAASGGGLGYAQGNACVSTGGGAAGQPCSGQPVSAQIDSFLAGKAFAASDLVLIQGGASDVQAAFAKLSAGGTQADFNTAVDNAAIALANQVKRLVNSGAKQVAVTNLYDLGKTPFAAARAATLTAATRRFNDKLKVEIVNLGNQVFLVDFEFFFNQLTGTATRSAYGIADVITPVCTTPTAFTCNTNTVIANVNITNYTFADTINLSPNAQAQMGSWAYGQIKSRF